MGPDRDRRSNGGGKYDSRPGSPEPRTLMASLATLDPAMAEIVGYALNETQFEFAELGLSDVLDNSLLHSFEDSISQGVIIAASSDDYAEQMAKVKAVLAIHAIDDKIDPGEEAANRRLFAECDYDPKVFFDRIGPLGVIGHRICQRETEALTAYAYKGMARMLVQGLTTYASPDEESDLLKRFMDLGCTGVDPAVAKEIRALDPRLYSMTSKTIMEFNCSYESDFDPTCAELWSLAYAPAIVRHDDVEEREVGELHLSAEELSTGRLLSLIELAGRHIPNFEPRPVLRARQVQFLGWALNDRLEPPLRNAYSALRAELLNMDTP